MEYDSYLILKKIDEDYDPYVNNSSTLQIGATDLYTVSLHLYNKTDNDQIKMLNTYIYYTGSSSELENIIVYKTEFSNLKNIFNNSLIKNHSKNIDDNVCNNKILEYLDKKIGKLTIKKDILLSSCEYLEKIKNMKQNINNINNDIKSDSELSILYNIIKFNN